MSNFSQKSTKITDFYQLSDEVDLLKKLIRFSRWKKPVLIIPALASEFTLPESRPVFENILRELKGAQYLAKIILGVDQGTKDDIEQLYGIIADIGIDNLFVQWNDGPHFSGLYELMQDAGIDLSRRGKGRNLFMSFGVAIAIGATSVGLLDADIKTFRRPQLDQLFFPVQAFDYEFSKAYYVRSDGHRFFGRVKRLLVDPILIALKRKFTDTGEDKVLRLVDFLLLFHYQLSGEVVIDIDLLKRMRYTLNWGVEILSLIEVYRKATQIAQVQFTRGCFDHKHQKISVADAEKGLHKMSIDIVTTLLKALIVEEGLEVSSHFFRDLAITYQSVAEDLIKKYAENARFNGLIYDRDEEERFVTKIITGAIYDVGELLGAPQNISNMFWRYTTMNSEFEEFNKLGLQKAILDAEERIKHGHLETGDLPSWTRVEEKIPGIIDRIIDAIEDVKQTKSVQ
jgi:glucosyl-3-phosphoglycerate synthase